MPILDDNDIAFLANARELGQNHGSRLPRKYRNQGYDQQGRFFDDNGHHFVFAGFWKNNNNYKRFSGEGYLSAGKEQPIFGIWKNGLAGDKNGTGSRFLNNEDFYIGEMSGGIPNGKGKIIFRQASPFSTFEGTFQNGMPDGVGTGKIKGVVQYTGKFESGKANGIFECKTPNSQSFWLEFENGNLAKYSLEGPGNNNTWKDSNSIRAGRLEEIILAEENGYGISIGNHDFYIGHFEDGERHGNGCALTIRQGFVPREIEYGAYEEITTSYEGTFHKDAMNSRMHGEITTKHRVTKNGILLKAASYTEQGHAELGWNDGQAIRKYETGDRVSGAYPKRPGTKVRFFEPDNPKLLKRIQDQASKPLISTPGITVKEDSLTDAPQSLIRSIFSGLARIQTAAQEALKEPEDNKKQIEPLGPEDNRGLHDIYGDPEERARRVVYQTESPSKPFIIADGSLYVTKGKLSLGFGKAALLRYDLEVVDIEEDYDAGTVTLETAYGPLVCDKVHGVSKELADTLRIERAHVYPKARKAQEDRENFPHMDWDSPN